MSATEVKVTTTNISPLTLEHEVLVMTFTSRDKAWSFYIECLGRPGVIDVTWPDLTIKTYNNVARACEALDSFIK